MTNFIRFCKSMAKYRSSTLFKNLVTGLLAVYLFYALSNLFFISNCVSGSSKASLFSHIGVRRPRLQADAGVVSMILIGERSILDDDRLNVIKLAPAILLIFLAFAFVRADLTRLYFRLTILPQRRYDYLSFCTLRI